MKFWRRTGNVTGVAVLNVEVVGKRIELLLEAVPGISEIGYLVRADNPAGVQGWEVAKAAAARLGVKLRRFDVNPYQPADLERAIATVANRRVGAMVVPADQPFLEQRSPDRRPRCEAPAAVGDRLSPFG